jgi:ABC-type sugar transport system, ATPase component
MIGRELSQEFPKRLLEAECDGTKTVLKVEGLTNGKLKNVSFELKQGEILGIAGLVGAGRTETARAIFGADTITEGEIYIKGKKVKVKSPLQAIRHGIGLIPEDRKRQGVMLWQSVSDNISLVVIQELAGRLLVNNKKEKALLDKEINMLNIKLQSVKQPVESLSGGNQQKVVLAKWLATKCDILIFDEPTRGIDVGAKKEIYDFLFRLKKEGKSVILISSEMSEILNLSDRILVMYEGRMTGELGYKDATQELVLRKASGM